MIMSSINAGIVCHQNDAAAACPSKSSWVVLGTATTNLSINITFTKCDNCHAIFIVPNVCCKKTLLEFGPYLYYHLINILSIYLLVIQLFCTGNNIVNLMNFIGFCFN